MKKLLLHTFVHKIVVCAALIVAGLLTGISQASAIVITPPSDLGPSDSVVVAASEGQLDFHSGSGSLVASVGGALAGVDVNTASVTAALADLGVG